MQRLYIDLGLDPHPARAALTGTLPPQLAGILGAPLYAVVGFFRNSEQEALANSSTAKFVLKKKGARNDAALFIDATLEEVGTGAAKTYKFAGQLLSDELITAIGEDESMTLVGCVTWTEPGEDEDLCLDFEFTLFNSASRDGDSIPATTDVRWAWAKELLPEANGFTHDEETKTISAAAGGGGAWGGITGTLADQTDLQSALDAKAAASSLTSHTGNTSNPHSVTKAQVGLGNCDNTSDANKPVSTATQTALNAKEATQTAATQAEAEAGTETAIRKWSPLRVKQAIAALGGSGSAISCPQVIFVETDGDDGTAEIGNPAKPFETATAAYAAGIAASGQFMLHLGFGVFTLDLRVGPSAGDWSGACVGVRGMGWGYNVSSSATVLQILGSPADSTNTNGINAFNVNVQPLMIDAYFVFDLTGGNVTVDNGSTYNGGNGGTIDIRGRGSFSIITRGGGDSLGSSDGVVQSGAPGPVYLRGDFHMANDGQLQCCDGTVYNTSPAGGGAVIEADGADFRNAGVPAEYGAATPVLGRCSFVSGYFPSFTDKGGNAAW